MVGRAVVENPYYWSDVDSELCGEKNQSKRSRRQLLLEYCEYAENVCQSHDSRGNVSMFLAKPILPLFHCQNNGKNFRIALHALIQGKTLPDGLRDRCRLTPEQTKSLTFGEQVLRSIEISELDEHMLDSLLVE